MSNGLFLRTFGSLAALAISLAAMPAASREGDEAAKPGASLEDAFRDPPNSARPRVWWHWLNGNITKDGIAKDLAWMHRVGIGGVQNFDVDLFTPQVVEKRLAYMTPEWKDAFRFAVEETDRLGLELAIAASPGWSETGGPWVPPSDGLKKLVWSQRDIVGGRRFAGKLLAPPAITGPFQGMPKPASFRDAPGSAGVAAKTPQYYRDVAVVAFPIDEGRVGAAGIVVSDSKGGALANGAALFDDDLTSTVEITGAGDAPPEIYLTYAKPQTVRSATLFIPGAAVKFFGSSLRPRLEASNDGKTWRPIAEVPADMIPTTVSFDPVTSRRFRMVFEPKDRSTGYAPPAEGVIALPMVVEQKVEGPAKLAIGELRLSPEARVDHFEIKAGFELVPDYYHVGAPAGEVSGVDPARVVDLTDRMGADGALDWIPPAGRWRVLRLGYSLLGSENAPAPPEATGLEVDKFDGAAVRRYLEHYLGLYRDASGDTGKGAGKGVDAILTDSIEVGAANWTPAMFEKFRELRGYELINWLPALTGTVVGSRAESDRFLYDFRRTLADLIASEHYGTVAQVARENGLQVYGEALEENRPSLGDDMAMRRHADIPMAAMWTYPRATGPKFAHLVDMRGAASVAHIYGQNLAAAESLTSTMAYWDFGPASLKRIIDLEFVNGINRPVIHTSVHVPVDDKKPGLSLFIFGQQFNRQEAWAELARPWVDYIARNAFLLQQGRNVADVGYFYGEEGPLTALFAAKPVQDAPSANAWDFINSDALMRALNNDGSEIVTVGGARYKALFLSGSSQRMTVAALKRLTALVEGGATVIGLPPQATPSLSDKPEEFAALVKKLWPGTGDASVGKGCVIATSDVDAGLAQAGVAPDFRVTGAGEGARIPFVHRKLADGHSYFIVNPLDRTQTVEAHFRVTGKVPRIWRAETGTSEEVSYRIENGETIIPLTLAPDESIHILFRQAAEVPSRNVTKPDLVPAGELDRHWKVSFQEGRGAPGAIEMAELSPLDENADAGVKYFSGVATYSREFQAPRRWKAGTPLILDLGEAREVAEVLVNGKHAGYAWHAPYTIDIGGLTRSGSNTLEVRVGNLWVNRLIGDAQEGAEKVTWTALPSYRADAPLRRSGLLGPVRLMIERK
jgi:hypothetical protein